MSSNFDEVAGWEVPSEALFACRAHTSRAALQAEFGIGQVDAVTWARIELSDFYCVVGDHHLTGTDRPDTDD